MLHVFSASTFSNTVLLFSCVHSFQVFVNCGTSQYNISCQLVSLHSRACGALHASASGGGPSKFSVDFHWPIDSIRRASYNHFCFSVHSSIRLLAFWTSSTWTFESGSVPFQHCLHFRISSLCDLPNSGHSEFSSVSGLRYILKFVFHGCWRHYRWLDSGFSTYSKETKCPQSYSNSSL